MVTENQEPILLESNQNHATIQTEGISTTLSASMGMGGGYAPMVTQGINGETAGTLDSNYYKGCGERQGTEREVVCIGNGQTAQLGMNEKCNTLDCMHDQQAVLENKYNNLVVRRLTPLECSRLQDYPDGWMDIGEWKDSKGKVHKESDAPKYKAAGNSIALPFWQWLINRIKAELDAENVENPTMASLFDGISGFPLCGIRTGITPVWSSEIEEFPIAVAEKHFGENGDIENIDLRIGDITKKDIGGLPSHMTASNFGKLSDIASKNDIALGILNMVFESVGMLAVFAARSRNTKDIVLTGSLSKIPQAKYVFEILSTMFDMNFVIPDNSEFGTVIGAALAAFEK